MPLGLQLFIGHSDPDSILGVTPGAVVELEEGDDFMRCEDGDFLELENNKMANKKISE